MRRPVALIAFAAILVATAVVLGAAAGGSSKRHARPVALYGFENPLEAPANRAAGVALAPSRVARPATTIGGSQRPDRLRGTAASDAIRGGPGDDHITAGGGDDFVEGGQGRDRIFGGAGNDRLAVDGDDSPDVVSCGPGRDVVTADAADTVRADCELVSRRLSRTIARLGGQLGTEVEPSAAASGQKVVAAYQVGRHIDGGSAATGFAVSRNGGGTWTPGILPGLGQSDGVDRVSDPVVAYDARHHTWLVASLTLAIGRRGGPETDAIVISRSTDGARWATPVTAEQGASLDKEGLSCDNWPRSPFQGRCYLSYLDVETNRIQTRWSDDGGSTWSPASPAPTPDPGWFVNGAQPVSRPDGLVVLVYAAASNFQSEGVFAVTSSDGGASFGAPDLVGRMADTLISDIRSPVLPSATVDGSGRVYVTWHDCSVLDDCRGNGVVLASSADGRSWSELRTVAAPSGRATDYFLPIVAADPTTGGNKARLAILYHVLSGCPIVACPGVDVRVTTSADSGLNWRSTRRLTAQPMKPLWLPDTGLGRMLGDYFGLAYAGRRPVAVFSLAAEPRRNGFRQGIAAAVLP